VPFLFRVSGCNPYLVPSDKEVTAFKMLALRLDMSGDIIENMKTSFQRLINLATERLAEVSNNYNTA
jgi:hypothetical protein